MRQALVLGLRDYVRKNGFAEVARRRLRRHRLGAHRGDRGRGARAGARALRVDAVALLVRGHAHRRAPARGEPRLRLPRDRDRADGRGVRRRARAESFAGREPDLTEENIQARIRGTLLMALSNKFGWLLVATGNKSEMSVGYATLYGDMAGGFALLKDVYKTDVFRLVAPPERAGRPRADPGVDHRPGRRARSCAPDQLDEDSLPPYAALDQVLEAYVEEDRSLEELSADGFDPDVVAARGGDDRPRRVQAPPGPARRAAAPEGVRARPPHADHEPLAELNGCNQVAGGNLVADSDAGVDRLARRPVPQELADERREAARPGHDRVELLDGRTRRRR